MDSRNNPQPNNCHKPEQPGDARQERRGDVEMFELMDQARSSPRDEHVDVERGLARFLRETGVDFLDLVNDKQLRIKTLVDGVDNHDTDQDEDELHHLYADLQKKAIED